MRLRHNAVTHVGRVRKINEDSILALPEQRIWVVADGMGGHAAGDVASQTVVDAVAALPLDIDPTEQMRALREALNSAHRSMLREIEARGGATMGATVVALMISGTHFVCFWAGDSRLYRLRAGVLEMLTTDHSVVAGMVSAGKLTWDEAEHHPQSNAITRAVGVGETLELDKVRGDVERGDRFLLCTDGLNKYAGLEQLRAAITGAPIETVTETLLGIALAGGGADNISIIVVDAV
ncbi:MAG: protein phosphatase 2C domain-containing protein [Sulfitobacter sp.]